jgi:hypothetical protein
MAEHWLRALTINPLFPDGWFSCGYACLKGGLEAGAYTHPVLSST